MDIREIEEKAILQNHTRYDILVPIKSRGGNVCKILEKKLFYLWLC